MPGATSYDMSTERETRLTSNFIDLIRLRPLKQIWCPDVLSPFTSVKRSVSHHSIIEYSCLGENYSRSNSHSGILEEILGTTRQPGMSIGVPNQGEVVFKHNSGVLDIENRQTCNKPSANY